MKPTVPPSFAEKDLNYYLRMIRGQFSELEESETAAASFSSKQKNIVVLLSSTHIGRGDDELGEKLLKFFLQALLHNRIKPRAIVLMNEAVRLAMAGSSTVKDLMLLEEQNIKIIACMASVDHFGEEQDLKVGTVADMDNICDYLLTAWKVISI